MLTRPVQTIEFIGGPMDGFQHKTVGQLKPFLLVKSACYAAQISMVSQLMRLLLFQGHSQLEIVAVYELDEKSVQIKFRYLGSTTATDIPVGDAIQVVENLPD